MIGWLRKAIQSLLTRDVQFPLTFLFERLLLKTIQVRQMKIPQNLYENYHAHVYFNAQTIAQAEQLCVEAGRRFKVKVGRVHRKIVGPHPHWSCQLAFNAAQFQELILWLEQNRNGLDILIHGLTGDDLEDHTVHASWLGEPQKLRLGFFSAYTQSQ